MASPSLKKGEHSALPFLFLCRSRWRDHGQKAQVNDQVIDDAWVCRKLHLPETFGDMPVPLHENEPFLLLAGVAMQERIPRALPVFQRIEQRRNVAPLAKDQQSLHFLSFLHRVFEKSG